MVVIPSVGDGGGLAGTRQVHGGDEHAEAGAAGVDGAADGDGDDAADGSLGDGDLVVGEALRAVGVLISEVQPAAEAAGGIGDVNAGARS